MTDLLEQGIIFFNSGRYFEAHEAWEDLWRPQRATAPAVLPGSGSGGRRDCTTCGRETAIGAQAQLQKSIGKLDQISRTPIAGIDVARLGAGSAPVLERVPVTGIGSKFDRN